MKFFKPDNLPNNVYRAPAWEMALYVILNPSIVHLIASLVPIPSALGFYRINSPEMLRVCWMSIFVGPIPLYGYNRVFDLHLHYNSHMTWLTSLNAIDLSVIIFNDDFDDARRFFPSYSCWIFHIVIIAKWKQSLELKPGGGIKPNSYGELT